MTDEERKLALYCLKASSDYHSEVCEECIKYPNCDHTGQDDVTETIIKLLEQEKYYKDLAQSYERTIVKLTEAIAEQRKKGHWIKVHPLQADDEGAYMCSCCEVGDWDLKGTENFCPNCGAEMESD